MGLKEVKLSLANKVARLVWGLVWFTLFRPSPRPLHLWRVLLLRIFGARVAWSCHVYPSTRIWAPWNLSMHCHSTLADHVDCYCVDAVIIGEFSTVSQYTYLCTAGHDYEDPLILTRPQMRLLTAPIRIGSRAWITADVFVGPGVTIGDGAVVLVRSVVNRDVAPWTVVAGTPATFRKRRSLRTN